MEREILSKAAAWFARETNVIPAEGFEVREREPGQLPHRRDVPRLGRLPQRLLRVGRSGRPRARAVTDAVLTREDPRGARGLEGHLRSAAHPIRPCRGRHPRRPETRRAADAGRQVSPASAVASSSPRRCGTVARQAPDLVDRNFTAERPNMLWVADITYIPTWAGFLYLAVVLDVFSRRIVGWSMATTLAHAGRARCVEHGAVAAARRKT